MTTTTTMDSAEVTPENTPEAMEVALACTFCVKASMALEIWSCVTRNGGPSNHFWILVNPTPT